MFDFLDLLGNLKLNFSVTNFESLRSGGGISRLIDIAATPENLALFPAARFGHRSAKKVYEPLNHQIIVDGTSIGVGEIILMGAEYKIRNRGYKPTSISLLLKFSNNSIWPILEKKQLKDLIWPEFTFNNVKILDSLQTSTSSNSEFCFQHIKTKGWRTNDNGEKFADIDDMYCGVWLKTLVTKIFQAGPVAYDITSTFLDNIGDIAVFFPLEYDENFDNSIKAELVTQALIATAVSLAPPQTMLFPNYDNEISDPEDAWEFPPFASTRKAFIPKQSGRVRVRATLDFINGIAEDGVNSPQNLFASLCIVRDNNTGTREIVASGSETQIAQVVPVGQPLISGTFKLDATFEVPPENDGGVYRIAIVPNQDNTALQGWEYEVEVTDGEVTFEYERAFPGIGTDVKVADLIPSSWNCATILESIMKVFNLEMYANNSRYQVRIEPSHNYVLWDDVLRDGFVNKNTNWTNRVGNLEMETNDYSVTETLRFLEPKDGTLNQLNEGVEIKAYAGRYVYGEGKKKEIVCGFSPVNHLFDFEISTDKLELFRIPMIYSDVHIDKPNEKLTRSKDPVILFVDNSTGVNINYRNSATNNTSGAVREAFMIDYRKPDKPCLSFGDQTADDGTEMIGLLKRFHLKRFAMLKQGFFMFNARLHSTDMNTYNFSQSIKVFNQNFVVSNISEYNVFERTCSIRCLKDSAPNEDDVDNVLSSNVKVETSYTP